VVGDEGEIAGYTLLSSEAAFGVTVDALNTHFDERSYKAAAFASTTHWPLKSLKSRSEHKGGICKLFKKLRLIC
jgi:hypothetical protein